MPWNKYIGVSDIKKRDFVNWIRIRIEINVDLQHCLIINSFYCNEEIQYSTNIKMHLYAGRVFIY